MKTKPRRSRTPTTKPQKMVINLELNDGRIVRIAGKPSEAQKLALIASRILAAYGGREA